MICYILFCVFVLFFFKQKTAYEMRISDWSSDVCSSDLEPPPGRCDAWSSRLASTPSSPSRTEPTRRGSFERACRSGGGALQDVHAAGRAEADDVGQAHLCALDLTVAGLAAEVVAHLPDVGDAGGGDRVALALEATGHVRSEEHTAELQSLMRTPSAVLCFAQN